MATISDLMDMAIHHYQSGNFREAEALCRRILQEQSNHAAAHQVLGLSAHRAGHGSAAIEFLRQAVALSPDDASCYFNLGVVLASQKQITEAIACYRQAVRLGPTFFQAHGNLGNALKGRGELAEAMECYRQALRANPNYGNAHYNLGNALREIQRPAEAIESFQSALRINPKHIEAWINVGSALKDQGKLGEAAQCFRQAIELNPNAAEAHNNLGLTLKDMGLPAEALAPLRQALRINPNYAEAHHNLGLVFKETLPAQAIACFQEALRLNPAYADAHNNLGVAWRNEDQPDAAILCFRKALAIDPRHADAYVNLGNALKDQGLLKKALACYRRAARLKPDDVADSNVLNMLHFCPEYTSTAIYEEHQRWYRKHAQPLVKVIRPHVNDRAPGRRLRIGYVSPDFRNHVVAMSFLPLFANHDHANYEICCFADVLSSDNITQRLRSYADVWQTIAGRTDEEVAELIRDERIDILVDLTMHMARNRLLVFARKPAPVQITWGAYPGTTGLATIDYRLTDPYLDPPGLDEEVYTETSIRLPDSFWCYDPLTSEPAVGPLPALTNGYLTFGCLSNFCKVNEPTLKLWARVLRATSASRLLLLAPEGKSRGRTLAVLANEGVAAERVQFSTRLPRREYLKLYHQMDIGLDTLPYNGHMTSLDALWMGVPVVTMVGPTVVGRAGLCHANNLGLEELVAWAPDDIVSTAVRLARGTERLSTLRAGLRQRLRSSPLMDGRRFARNIEAAYRDMWRRWCAEPG